MKTHLKSLILQVGEQYAKDNRLMFLETSAKTAQNVNELFYEIGEYIHCLSFCSSVYVRQYLLLNGQKVFQKRSFALIEGLKRSTTWHCRFFASIGRSSFIQAFIYKHLLLLIIIYRLQERDWQKLPLPSRAE